MQPTAAAAEALPGLLDGLRERGVDAVRVCDVLG